MNVKMVILAFSLGMLVGCSTPTRITLIDGKEIITTNQPHYDKRSGFYEFKQYGGARSRINKDQVRSITEL